MAGKIRPSFRHSVIPLYETSAQPSIVIIPVLQGTQVHNPHRRHSRFTRFSTILPRCCNSVLRGSEGNLPRGVILDSRASAPPLIGVFFSYKTQYTPAASFSIHEVQYHRRHPRFTSLSTILPRRHSGGFLRRNPVALPFFTLV